jgi:hypothetical protein
MYFKGLFTKRIYIAEGEALLTEYCSINGFDDNTTHWKKPAHSKHLFAYRKCSNKRIAANWVSFHPTRDNNKYSIWIDLVTEEITEILRSPA